jgi:hypothetical protein
MEGYFAAVQRRLLSLLELVSGSLASPEDARFRPRMHFEIRPDEDPGYDCEHDQQLDVQHQKGWQQRTHEDQPSDGNVAVTIV